MKWFGIIVLILFVAAVGYVIYQETTTAEIPIEDDFGSKIVYTTDLDMDTGPLRAHCEALGGTFQACGTTCEPGAAICAQVCAYTCENIPNGGTNGGGNGTSTEESFSDEQYDFSIEYPGSGWSVLAATSTLSTLFNIYNEAETNRADLPLTHFSEATHVSVYPEGIPTEGLFAQSEDIDFDTPFAVAEGSRMYVLENGTPFAAYILPADRPESWNSSGFVWVRVEVDNAGTRCERDGEVISEQQCDPLTMGDEVIWTGSVDSAMWDQVISIFNTLKLE